MIKILKENHNTILIFIIPLILVLIGYWVYRDYGVSLDEEISRMNGLVSIKYICELLFPQIAYNFELIKNIPNLESYSDKQYGTFYEILLIFILEILFEIKNFSEIIYYRHLLNHFVFIASVIVFYFLCLQLFGSKLLSFFGAATLYSSPRIFADSFYNNKDLIFLSFFIFLIFFSIKYIKKSNYSNAFLLSIFAAIAINLRIIAFYVGILIAIFFIIDFLMKNKIDKKKVNTLIFFFILQFIFLYLFWPFLWENPIENFAYTIKSFSRFTSLGMHIFYLGDFHNVYYLPWHYIFVCFFVTTPILISFLIAVGLFQLSLRFFKRLIHIDQDKPCNDIWRGEKEKIFLFIFFIIFIPIFSFFLFNTIFYNNWRHLFFLYPPLILTAIFAVNTFRKKFIKKNISIYINGILILILINNLYNLVTLHPFQYVYFNSIFEKKANKLFAIDYWGVSNKSSLESILLNNSQKNKIKIGVASFTNLYLSKKMLNEESKRKLIITGQDFTDADFIFNNNYFELNPKYSRKYLIPQNYIKHSEVKRGDILINEFYIKK